MILFYREGYKKESQKDSKEGKVFKKSTKICNLGEARYRTELASKNNYKLSEGFAHVVCKLPASYDKDVYMKFIEKWGTVSSFIYYLLRTAIHPKFFIKLFIIIY